MGCHLYTGILFPKFNGFIIARYCLNAASISFRKPLALLTVKLEKATVRTMIQAIEVFTSLSEGLKA